ncbi:Fc.00g042390.m01.CDS01 [Cosmosporella sp. VM-42]
MTGAIATPRFSHDDFETASIRSAAPSYVSEAPSYHSVAPYPEALPSYTPPARNVAAGTTARSGTSTPRQRSIGLPPVPAMPLTNNIPNLNNFRIATWSTASNNPTARLYHSVAQRRVTAQRDPVDSLRRVMTEHSLDPVEESIDSSGIRPLEDPYLVGEVAAARARRERIARETGDDILIREDRQWDWFLARIKDSDERERAAVPKIRREVDIGHRKKLLRRIGGRRLL